MLDLRLRQEFLTDQMRDTTITFHRPDKTGALDQTAEQFFEITYPSLDLQRGLHAISMRTEGRPIVLLAERGRGKSHVMAAMHHALQHPAVVEHWAKGWIARPDAQTEILRTVDVKKNYLPITVGIHDSDYPFLWDILFKHHPQGTRFLGRFDADANSVPPRKLIEEMLQTQPVALILDEFQTWYEGRRNDPADSGMKHRSWAFHFTQNLAEIASERPELLLFVISVRDNTTDVYQQVHRNNPVLIDFRDPISRTDRQRLVLHRLFENRHVIPTQQIEQLTAAYRMTRFHQLIRHHDSAGQAASDTDVVAAWPFSPELFTILEDQILRSAQSQGLRDLIRILVLTYQEWGNVRPILTPASFDIVEDSQNVKKLIDAIVSEGQQKLREMAMRNFVEVQRANLPLHEFNVVGVMSALWMRSFAVESQKGALAAQLHTDITQDSLIDDNSFNDALNQIVENSFNIHQVTESGETRYIFKEDENPRAKLLASAKNDKLFEHEEDSTFLRKLIRTRLTPATQSQARVIVLDAQWETAPWNNISDERDRPDQWESPVLIVLPVYPADVHATLGKWLVRHIRMKRNMVRFLLPEQGKPSLFIDPSVRQYARVIELAKRWEEQRFFQFSKEFEKKLDEVIVRRFTRFAVLRLWNYQQPMHCAFTIESLREPITKVSTEIDQRMRTDVFHADLFADLASKLARKSSKVGELLDTLREPPGNPEEEAIVFISESQICEQLLRLTAQGTIALNSNGTLLAGRAGESSDDAFIRLRPSGFKTGRDLADMLIVSPHIGGSTTIGDVSSELPTPSPIVQPPNPIPEKFESAAPGNAPQSNQEQTSSVVSSFPDPSLPEDDTAPPPLRRRTRRTTRNRPLNLVAEVERMVTDTRTAIPIAKIEFTGITASDLKALLGRLPQTLQAVLEIETDDGQEVD